MTTRKFGWSGPRWAHTESYLRDLAWGLDLRIDIEVEKYFLRESGRCSVTGDESTTKLFIKMAEDAITAYNIV